jgi:hypothetical protein
MQVRSARVSLRIARIVGVAALATLLAACPGGVRSGGGRATSPEAAQRLAQSGDHAGAARVFERQAKNGSLPAHAPMLPVSSPL